MKIFLIIFFVVLGLAYIVFCWINTIKDVKEKKNIKKKIEDIQIDSLDDIENPDNKGE